MLPKPSFQLKEKNILKKHVIPIWIIAVNGCKNVELKQKKYYTTYIICFPTFVLKTIFAYSEKTVDSSMYSKFNILWFKFNTHYILSYRNKYVLFTSPQQKSSGCL